MWEAPYSKYPTFTFSAFKPRAFRYKISSLIDCCCFLVALFFGETRTLIAEKDQPVSVRCHASIDDHLRWVKLKPSTTVAAATADDDDDHGRGWLEVSRRRRLILDADTEGRDGVYLCILYQSTGLSSRTSSEMASLAANVTVVSPCKHTCACRG